MKLIRILSIAAAFMAGVFCMSAVTPVERHGNLRVDLKLQMNHIFWL